MVDAARKTGLCAAHYTDTLRVAVDRPAPRWPIRTVLVPQVTNILNDCHRSVPVNLPREPWHKEQTA
jgi:hypothetical protein